MSHFRKRLDANIINELNEWIVLEEQKKQDDDENYPNDSGSKENPNDSSPAKTQNKGKLILDATCKPADIALILQILGC